MAIARPAERARAARAPVHWRRLVAWTAAALAAGLALFCGGFSWYFSGELNQSALDGAARRASGVEAPYSIRVLAMPADGSITLSVPSEPDVLLQNGTWGLEDAGGAFGQIGAVRGRDAGRITRDYRPLTRVPLRVGDSVRLVHQAYPADPFVALGLSFEDVSFGGPLGSYPAWLIAGSISNWAILVHGNSMMRADVLRMAGPIHDSGFTVMAISYRNDPGAPADPSGMLRYGLTEWQDLEAAVRYALSHGAQHIVLGGVSMGGGIVMSFLYRSPLARDVSAVILDSPMLDFSRTVDYQAARRTFPVVDLPLPGPLVAAGKWVTGLRFGVDWDALDYLSQVVRLKAPILLFHGTADELVPIATSEQLVAARPDLVTYVVTPGAGHVDSWNLAPERYDHYVMTFLG